MDEPRRSVPARLGIVALNLLLPGLGWFRLGNGRAGLAWLALVVSELLAVLAVYALAPIPTFPQFAVAFAVLAALGLANFLVPMISNWRSSVSRSAPGPWWTRWYALAALAVAGSAVGQGMTSLAHHFYQPFYIPSESMAPTIARYEKFFTDMRSGQPIRCGAVLVLESREGKRVYRAVGLPGDRIAMRSGIPVVNGQPAFQRFDATITYESFDGPATARRFEERLPGEVGTHFILDSGYVPELDDVAEILVPPGHLFVLGDNRDRAADSRVPPDRTGIGLPAVEDVRGRPLFIHWSRDRSRIGTRINP